nr:transposase [Bradyrhizobium guangxiense]
MNVESYRRRTALERKRGPGRPPSHATPKPSLIDAARQSEFNKTLARDNHRGNHHQAATRLAILIAAHFLPRLPRYIVSKFGDHTPFYRQSEIYARQGLRLDRATLGNCVVRGIFSRALQHTAAFRSKPTSRCWSRRHDHRPSGHRQSGRPDQELKK